MLPPRRKKVAVIGYGYVGRQMANMFRTAFDVVAYDSSEDVINKWSFMNLRPEFHLINHKVQVQGVDLAVICVPTPMAKDGSCDTSIVEEVCGWIDAPLVCIKSTVPPGFTQRMNDADNQLSDNNEPRFHFSPEYAGEPINHVPPQYPDPRDSVKHDFCIVGGPRAGEVLGYFARVMATSARYVTTDSTTAELCKYMENAYFATKIIFCTEFAMIAHQMGVDYKELRNLWTLDSRVDPDHTMVFLDSLGFSGKCLPKDLMAIIRAAQAAGYEPTLLKEVYNNNLAFRGVNEVAEAAE